MSTRSGSNPGRRGRRAIRGALLAPLLVLALSATAHAEVPNHPFLGALVSGLEPEPKPLRPKLEAPCGVAVDSAGSIYVSDYRRRTVSGITLPDLFPGNGPCTLASDGNNLYVSYWHGAVINPDAGVIYPSRSFGVAVDTVTKNLYVNRGTSIAVYEAPVEPGDTPLMEVGGGGALVNSFGVAVSTFPATAGDVYAADAATNTVKVFDPTVSLTVPVQEIDGRGTAAGRFVSLRDTSLAIDQSNGHLFVVDNTQPGFEHPLAAIDEFNAEGIYRGQLEHAIVDGAPVGITVDESATAETGQVYVTSGNGSSSVIPPELGPPASEQGALYAFGVAGSGQKLSATVSGVGDGSVTSDPAGIACPGACEAELNSGAIINLTATAEPGSVFAGWSGACLGNGDCQVILGAATTVNAKFDPAPALLGAGGASVAAATTSGPGEAASKASGAAGARPQKQAGHRSTCLRGRHAHRKRGNASRPPRRCGSSG